MNFRVRKPCAVVLGAMFMALFPLASGQGARRGTTPFVLQIKARPCMIGVTYAEAQKTSALNGLVRFRLKSFACSPGEVQVAVGATENQGKVELRWSPSQTISVTLPPDGKETEDQIVSIAASGTGSMKFRISILSCNGKPCELETALDPEHLITKEVLSFPQ